jgi:hypothetical protein
MGLAQGIRNKYARYFNRGGDHRKPTNTGTSLTTLIANATAGTTIYVPGNRVYRETVNVNKTLTLKCGKGAEVRASDVWTSWTLVSGTTYRSTLTVPALTTEPTFWQYEPIADITAATVAGATVVNCTPTNEIFLGDLVNIGTGSDATGPVYELRRVTAKTSTSITVSPALTNAHPTSHKVNHGEGSRPEQVYIDGVPCRYTTNATPGPLEFSMVDAATDRRILIGVNPAGKVIEVTTRNMCVTNAANSIVIEGLSMFHGGSRCYQRNSGSNHTFRRCEFAYAHALGANFGPAVITAEECWFHRNGLAGIYGTGSTATVTNSRIGPYNNRRYFRTGWGAGANKWVNNPTLTLFNNEVDYNIGNGWWYDLSFTPQTLYIGYERVHHNGHRNQGDGIRIEVGTNATIENAILYENITNIHIAASHNVAIENCKIAWGKSRGLQIDQQYRTSAGRPAEDWPWDRTRNVQHQTNDVLQEIFTGQSQRYAVCRFHDCNAIDKGGLNHAGTTPIYSEPDNFGTNNRYFFAGSTGLSVAESTIARFKWGSATGTGTCKGAVGNDYSTLANFNAGSGESGSTYMSQATKDALCKQWAIPLVPE